MTLRADDLNGDLSRDVQDLGESTEAYTEATMTNAKHEFIKRLSSLKGKALEETTYETIR